MRVFFFFFENLSRLAKNKYLASSLLNRNSDLGYGFTCFVSCKRIYFKSFWLQVVHSFRLVKNQIMSFLCFSTFFELNFWVGIQIDLLHKADLFLIFFLVASLNSFRLAKKQMRLFFASQKLQKFWVRIQIDLVHALFV